MGQHAGQGVGQPAGQGVGAPAAMASASGAASGSGSRVGAMSTSSARAAQHRPANIKVAIPAGGVGAGGMGKGDQMIVSCASLIERGLAGDGDGAGDECNAGS